MVVVDSREHFSSFADVVVAGPDSNPIAAGVSTSAGLEGEPEADTLVLGHRIGSSDVSICRIFTSGVLSKYQTIGITGASHRTCFVKLLLPSSGVFESIYFLNETLHVMYDILA